MKTALLLALFVLGLQPACRGSTPNEERKLPQLNPGPFQIPVALRIPVIVDGVSQNAIDAAKLQARPPDYRDDEHHAWRLDRLLAAEIRTEKARVSGIQSTGAAIVVQLPAERPVPVLVVNRRGQVLLTLVDPSDPFPRFHGQGGRLARPGQQNLQAVIERIEITTTGANPRQIPPDDAPRSTERAD